MEDDLTQTQRKQQAAENSLWQQNLKSWRPLMTPGCISSIFIVWGVIFLMFGSIILSASMNTIEQEQRYDDACSGSSCTITMTIEKEMKAPVYFYYKLVNFYQNHRAYVMDYDIDQLQGDVSDTDSCTVSETKERGGKVVYPCGLIANSFFNDVFTVTHIQGGTSTVLSGKDWDGSNIAWKSDVDTKFKNASTSIDPALVTRIGTQGNTLPLPTDQDFMVWFQVAGLPRFNKLYRKIGDTDLKKGDVLSIQIANNFDVDNFGGEKRIFLSTTTWLGGSNYFLGSVYMIVGGLCLLYACLMLLKRYMYPRKLGEMKYHSWSGFGPTSG